MRTSFDQRLQQSSSSVKRKISSWIRLELYRNEMRFEVCTHLRYVHTDPAVNIGTLKATCYDSNGETKY